MGGIGVQDSYVKRPWEKTCAGTLKSYTLGTRVNRHKQAFKGTKAHPVPNAVTQRFFLEEEAFHKKR